MDRLDTLRASTYDVKNVRFHVYCTKWTSRKKPTLLLPGAFGRHRTTPNRLASAYRPLMASAPSLPSLPYYLALTAATVAPHTLSDNSISRKIGQWEILAMPGSG